MNNEHWVDYPSCRNLIKTRKIPNVSSKTLKGRNFCITGTLETLYRDEIVKIIKAKGGKYSCKIGPKTNVLLVGTWYPNEHWTAPPHKWNYWKKYKMKNTRGWATTDGRANILLKGETDFINFLIHEDKKIKKNKKGFKMIIIIFFFFLYYFRFSFVYLEKLQQPQPFLLKM